MSKKIDIRCVTCDSKVCAQGVDCFSKADEHIKPYSDKKINEIHRAASAIEARQTAKKNLPCFDNILQ